MKYHIGARLTDPHGVLDKNPQQLVKLQDKVSNMMTRLFQQPDRGGNPFLFALTVPRPHELLVEIPGLGFPFETAATDGQKYYWHPDFLEKLSADELPTVMQHEGYHTTFFHPMRMKAAHPRYRNWAMDYVVNACIEVDHETTKRKGQLWGGNLGEPIPLKELCDHIDGKIDADFEEPRIFADKSLHGRSPESIYDEIMKHVENSPRKCKTCGALSLDPKTGKPKGKGPCKNRPKCPHEGLCCPDCGVEISPMTGEGYGDGMPFPMDAHIDGKLSKQEIQSDVMRAAQQATHMRGTVPSDIEDYLGELMKPTLKFTDIVRSACLKKCQDAGLKNDWKRFRRRYLPYKMYLPKRHTHKPRWLAMIDTSGSMSQDDLTYGISQLKVLGNHTEGFIVPCDANVDWGSVTSVKNLDDLKRTKIVGRGGTVFDDFFREFPEHLGLEFDCVVIITDGDCGDVPVKLRPPLDVVWVITRKDRAEFKPTFGRVAPLRNASL
jgi:predicted metal-dependent peptidase